MGAVFTATGLSSTTDFIFPRNTFQQIRNLRLLQLQPDLASLDARHLNRLRNKPAQPVRFFIHQRYVFALLLRLRRLIGKQCCCRRLNRCKRRLNSCAIASSSVDFSSSALPGSLRTASCILRACPFQSYRHQIREALHGGIGEFDASDSECPNGLRAKPNCGDPRRFAGFVNL